MSLVIISIRVKSLRNNNAAAKCKGERHKCSQTIRIMSQTTEELKNLKEQVKSRKQIANNERQGFVSSVFYKDYVL